VGFRVGDRRDKRSADPLSGFELWQHSHGDRQTGRSHDQ
jgi:hypothetical protein